MKNRAFIAVFAAVLTAVVVSKAQVIFDDGDAETWYSENSYDYGETNIFIGTYNPNNTLTLHNVAIYAGGVSLGYSNASSSNTLNVTSESYLQVIGSVTVGVDSTDNQMDIEDGSFVYSGAGVIGREADASGNEVTVSGEGSGWQVLNNMIVGYEGSSNRLEVTDESWFVSQNLLMGASEDSTGNEVEVSDATLVVYDSLYVGYEGSENRLELSDGSVATTDKIYVGYEGSENRLELSDGSVATSDTIYVGYGSDANNNEILITGTDTVWTNYSSVYVGTNGTVNNLITVDDGAELIIEGGLYIEEDNQFVLGDDGLLTVHSDLDAGVGFTFGEGASLSVGGALTGLDSQIEDGHSVMIFSDEGEWDLSDSALTVGASSSNNTLQVDGGATVTVDQLSVGIGTDTDDNIVLVDGDGSQLLIATSLSVGSASSENNIVTVSDGGVIDVEGSFDLSGDNAFNVSSGGRFSVGGALDASMEGFNFDEYGTIEVGGVLSGMEAVLDGGRSVWLTGSDASWDVGMNTFEMSNSTLVVSSGATWTSADAELGADSLLVITNGGVGTSSSAIIGFGNNSEVVVSGEDSLWTIENDLVVGMGGTGNSLSLEHGGLVEVGGTLSLANSQLSIDSGSAVMVDNYYQDASSTLTFDSVSTQGLITASSDAEFEAGASIAFTGSISNISIGVINSQLLVSSDVLTVDGETNVTSNDLDTINVEMSNNLFSYDLYADNNDLYVDFYRHALSSSAGFEPGTEMYEISGEIDGLSTNGSEAAVNQLIILGQMSAGVDGEQNAQLRQLYERNAPTFMHMEGLYEGMRQVKRNGVMPDSMWPVGAAGPHLYGDQVRGWVKGYGSWASQDGDGSYSSYDQDIFGVVVGFDKAFGDLLVGLAGGYTMSDISQDDGDQSESSTGFGMLYSSWGSSAWFLDGSLAFGMGSVENETGTQFDTSAEFDANQLAFYLGGGKELLYLDDRLIVTPSAGILGGLYMQEGYTEQADNAIARKVDDYNRFSFRSEFGVQAIFHKHLKKFVLMPETHVNWLHEFNDDEDQVDFSLVGGTGSYSFGMQAPVSDILEVGVGLSLWAESRNNVVYEWALGFDSRFGDGYSANAINARLVVEF